MADQTLSLASLPGAFHDQDAPLAPLPFALVFMTVRAQVDVPDEDDKATLVMTTQQTSYDGVVHRDYTHDPD